jgi:anti-sigma-K factor RskA
VSACPTHAALLGGYVLGSLDPAEMEEMRRHVLECPHCGREARALELLPPLLDRIEPDDVPPPSLSPAVEEAVLDRFARERSRERRARRQRPSARARLPRVAALAAACAAAVVLAVVLLGEDESGSRAYASARLAPLSADSGAVATAWADDVPAGTRVRLRARGLPVREGAMYELWCIRADGRWVSGGTFRAGADGRAEAVLTAAVRPGDYHVMVVTRHMAREAQGDHGPALLRGRLRY